MRKLTICVLLILLLCGCAKVDEFEIMGDIHADEQVEARRISLTLPEDAAQEVMEGAGGTIYFCNGYEITISTHPSGDLARTLNEVTGYDAELLTVICSERDGNDRYDCAWASAGEGGDQMSRMMILDDGNYHYCMTMSCNAIDSGSLQAVWEALTDTFALV